MNMTLAYLRGRRAWLIEGLKVWGTASEAEFYLTALETIGSDNRICLWHVTLGGYRQEVKFDDLEDKRGNKLPSVIINPAVVVIPRESDGAYIKAVTEKTGFVIVKSNDNATTVSVDLMIFETGF